MKLFPILSSILKRSFMPLVDKDYAAKKLAKRKGQCKKCAQCCTDCPWLDETTLLCTTYDNRAFWKCFKDFPLDRQDQEAWEVKDCGYHFDDPQ